jgi:hypothetical protein
MQQRFPVAAELGELLVGFAAGQERLAVVRRRGELEQLDEKLKVQGELSVGGGRGHGQCPCCGLRPRSF